MTPSELKYNYEQSQGGFFFTHNTMRSFGDTMRNYGVRLTTIQTYADIEPVEVWELYRKRPVKGGLQSSAYFEIGTYQQRHAKRISL